MLRRLTPFLTTLLAMLLDTAVIPVFYHGGFTVPLTLVVVTCIGLLKGRLQLNRKAFQIAQVALLLVCFSGILSTLLSKINSAVYTSVVNLFLLIAGGM